MSAHVKRCRVCGYEGTTGFRKIGHGFSLRGRTRTAQRLAQGPAVWVCKGEHRNHSLPKTPGAGKVEAAGIEPARHSLPKPTNSRRYCYSQCANPDFNECGDCWRDAQEAT